ncbi:MAG: translational GTPase TypA [Coxiella-like endosymbiont]|uniref:translational GTPase TypA n=1 Tax=Coxiella-like endosymbiont TaxID=1592897 RepID=UPI00215AD1DE|nr:translational GTPase TypA [Coxiella-like endosymbiont]UVE59564.1 translational GTPase TypA [Coxiella-like endosymbiont]
MMENIRNIAIIAHVDHGKTTLVDQLFQQSGTLGGRTQPIERAMDSNELERERGITILAKNTAIRWLDYRINIVDTPGHADFGGEVERILPMVDSVLLLVDAVEGPMPQTRFVTQKAFSWGLKPIVVVNKIDRPGARPNSVIEQVFDLFISLDATDEQLDFPIIYASALKGYATLNLSDSCSDMTPLFETIVSKVAPPNVDLNGPFQMQISSLDYSSYVGTIGIGRIQRGTIQPNTPVVIIDREGKRRSGRVLQLLRFLGLQRVDIESAEAGDIVAVTGMEDIRISDTLCDSHQAEALPPLTVDEPTVRITFQVNSSPFSGKEGKFLTSRQIKERLQKESIANLALKVMTGHNANKFIVSGRGELHLSILIENMRREGYEFSVSCPEVVRKIIDDVVCEPFENLVVDIKEKFQGDIIQALAKRKGNLKNMFADGKGRARLNYVIPTRGLIGFRAQFLMFTSGSGIMHHAFDHYGPIIEKSFRTRNRGVLISSSHGVATAYALWNLQAKGNLFISPQQAVYEGMIVGQHARDNDLVINVCREKQLTNIRAAGGDENIILTPPVIFSLEQALQFIADDELVEITPKSIRLRKKSLKEDERRRIGKQNNFLSTMVT